ncbi:MAG TPA: twin-arginine translocation pathway signal protein [Pseudaminobacter sp.]|nr:twin-arginine translocation pathway signal protein [Pseudaminobacter sp.]
MERRRFLTLMGGGVILAAGSAAGAFAVTRTPTRALMPWTQTTFYDEPRRRALSFAILAPNPHNRQPWLVDLATPGEVLLLVDTARMLPHTDPQNRQITIGLGCFLELMVTAAAADGYRVDLELFPQGADAAGLDARPVARARFIKDATIAIDPLFEHVLTRRSLKEPYDLGKPVATSLLASLAASIRHGSTPGHTNDPDVVSALRDLTHRALDIEIDTSRTYKESVDLFRLGKAEIEANPDGIDFGGPLFDTLVLTGQFTRTIALDKSSMVFAQGRDAVLANTDTAMAHFWLVTGSNTRQDQIAAGRDWVRVHLAATALGLGLQPLSQALQEFPEMAACYAQAHQKLAPAGGTVQMLARLGYATPVGPSPRWPLDAKIIAEG